MGAVSATQNNPIILYISTVSKTKEPVIDLGGGGLLENLA